MFWTMTAQTVLSKLDSRSARSLKRTNSTPGTRGAKGKRYFSVEVTLTAPKVRPWKELCRSSAAASKPVSARAFSRGGGKSSSEDSGESARGNGLRRGGGRSAGAGGGLGADGHIRRRASGQQAQGHARGTGDLCLGWTAAGGAGAEIFRSAQAFPERRFPLSVGDELSHVRVG